MFDLNCSLLEILKINQSPLVTRIHVFLVWPEAMWKSSNAVHSLVYVHAFKLHHIVFTKTGIKPESVIAIIVLSEFIDH